MGWRKTFKGGNHWNCKQSWKWSRRVCSRDEWRNKEIIRRENFCSFPFIFTLNFIAKFNIPLFLSGESLRVPSLSLLLFALPSLHHVISSLCDSCMLSSSSSLPHNPKYEYHSEWGKEIRALMLTSCYLQTSTHSLPFVMLFSLSLCRCFPSTIYMENFPLSCFSYPNTH